MLKLKRTYINTNKCKSIVDKKSCCKLMILSTESKVLICS